MSGDTQVLDQNPVSTPASGSVAVSPVGSSNKEASPIGTPNSEFIKPSEIEPQIDKDIKELGVEAKKDEPNIGDEHKHIINHAKQFIPASSSLSSKITMPMSETEIASKLKAGQDDDSGKWLAGLLNKIIAWGLKAR